MIGRTGLFQVYKIHPLHRHMANNRVRFFKDALCFIICSVLADSLVLSIPLLRQAPKS